jgi:hypothetical protein
MTRPIGISVPHRRVVEDDDDIQDYVKPWVGLSNGEMIELSEMKLGSWDLILEVEAKLKEKNCA